MLQVDSHIVRESGVDNNHDMMRHACIFEGARHEFDSTQDLDLDLGDRQWVFEGAGNFKACRELVRVMFRTNAECWTNTCSFAGVYQPRLSGQTFIAFSGFAKTVVVNLKLPWDVSLLTLIRTAESLCSKPWEDVKLHFDDIPEADAKMLCFSATYISVLLHDGYGMDKLGTRILFLEAIDGFELDWTLG